MVVIACRLLLILAAGRRGCYAKWRPKDGALLLGSLVFHFPPTLGHSKPGQSVACQNENEMKCSESCWKWHSALTNNFISCLRFSFSFLAKGCPLPLISFFASFSSSSSFIPPCLGINFIWFRAPFAGHETMQAMSLLRRTTRSQTDITLFSTERKCVNFLKKLRKSVLRNEGREYNATICICLYQYPMSYQPQQSHPLRILDRF